MRKLLLISAGLALVAAGAFAGGDASDRLSFTNEEAIDIEWGGFSGGSIKDGNWVQTHLEEMFNVNLSNRIMNGGNTEATNVMIASGDYPEVIYAFIDMIDWYFKGAFRDIPRDMLETYAPHHTAWRNDQGALAWGVSLSPGKTDEYMNIPRAEHYQQGCDRTSTMRLDWLREVGMDPQNLDGKAPELGANNGLYHDEGFDGTNGVPDTYIFWFGHFDWDEIETIMQRWRAEDFNGNGRPDEIMFGGLGDRAGGHSGSDLLFFKGHGPVFNAHGVNDVENYFDPEQNMTVLEDTYSRSREALKTLQRWFQSGYLDPALPAVTDAQWQQQWTSGLTGWWSRGFSCGTSARYGPASGHCANVVKNAPEAKLLTPLPPKGPIDGKAYCPMDGRATPLNPHEGFSVRHDVSDEKLARILQIFDYANYHPEGMVNVQYGTPGVFFEWQGTPYDCENSWLTAIPGETGRGEAGFFYYNSYHWHDGIRFCGMDKTRTDITELQLQTSWRNGLAVGEFDPQQYIGKTLSPGDHREDIFTRTQFLQKKSELGDALGTLRDEHWWRYVTTDIDIDADWPRYVQQWMDLGGREVLAELNKAPLVTDIRAGSVPWPSN